MGHSLIADVLVAQVNISNKIPAFWRQFLLQNTSFMSLVTKLASATVKQKMNAIVKNLYFKLPANNITPSILEEFSLKKNESNIKADALFLHSLIRKASGVKKVNAANGDKNMSATTPLATKSREDCQFQHSQRESEGGDIHSRHTQSKNNTADKFSFNKDSSEGYDSSDSDSNPDVIGKGYRNCYRNKALIATVSFCMMAYARNKYNNLFQIMTGYFSFAHNVSERKIEVYHKMGLVVSYETVWRALNANEQAVLRLLRERVNVERFFLSYNNMNFYKKVQDHRVHNKNH